MVTPTRGVEAARDPDDNRVLECAVGARSDAIVTSDQDLPTLVSFEGIEIVSPAAFVNRVLSQ